MPSHETQPVPPPALRERFLTPDEAANLLGKRVSTLSAWRSTGTGPTFIKVGGSVRYLEADLEAFLASGRRAPARRHAA